MNFRDVIIISAEKLYYFKTNQDLDMEIIRTEFLGIKNRGIDMLFVSLAVRVTK